MLLDFLGTVSIIFIPFISGLYNYRVRVYMEDISTVILITSVLVHMREVH